jgi:site-specific DNA-methyltransferase (adenine-specific)
MIDVQHKNAIEYTSKLDTSSIDLIIIDPPYITTKERWDQTEQVNPQLVEQLWRVAKDSCSIYVWCGIGEKSQSLIRWFPVFNDVFYFKDLITWKKQRGIGMRKGWLYTREELMWFVKNNKKFVWNKEHQYSQEKRVWTAHYANKERREKYLKNLSPYKRITNVWSDVREANIAWNRQDRRKFHFTPKPNKAIKRIIESHTSPGDNVLDCFLGSGTTAFCCKELDRNFYGCDANKEYVKMVTNYLDSFLL